MQVRKFEAKTMKDALEMVKIQLGPEAIILSARDNSKGFGLIGEKSVEVTAAVSEETLKRKALAERKLNQAHKERYSKVSARTQREFIAKAFREDRDDERPSREMTSRRYIDILDEEMGAGQKSEVVSSAVRNAKKQFMDSLIDDEGQGGDDDAQTQTSPNVARARIRNAALEAWEAVQPTVDEEPQKVRRKAAGRAARGDTHEIVALRKEIHHLKGMIEKFQKVPQSFVTMHPGADEGVPFELSFMYEKLLRSGISQENVVELLKQAQEEMAPAQLKKKPYVDAWVAKYLLNTVQVSSDWLRGRYHAFTGGVGQGKTSALVKLASHLVICEKKQVAILTTDSIKLGAAEQLRIYAQILNIPFGVIRRPEDWDVIEQRLRHVDHILIDYPGLKLKSMDEVDRVRTLLPSDKSQRVVHYVQSVLAKDSDALEVAGRYKMIGFDDVIFTCLDETVQHGLIYNFQRKFSVPLHSFGIGSKIPEDFEPATKERVVDLIFKLTKVKKERGRS